MDVGSAENCATVGAGGRVGGMTSAAGAGGGGAGGAAGAFFLQPAAKRVKVAARSAAVIVRFTNMNYPSGSVVSLTPNGAEIQAFVRQSLRRASICQHRIDLGTPAARGRESEMRPVRRPAWILVAAFIVRQLDVTFRSHIHREYVELSRGESAGPGKRDDLTVRMPGRIRRFARSIAQAFDIATVDAHLINLLRTGAAGDKYHLRARFGTDLRLRIDKTRVRNRV